MALKTLLRFSWQTLNIGHAPGALRIFERQHLNSMAKTAGLNSVANP